jgi:DNA-binding HxlR family transcriptional regulator
VPLSVRSPTLVTFTDLNKRIGTSNIFVTVVFGGYRRGMGPSSATDPYRDDGPTREAIQRIANKWTVHVIKALEHGPRRFLDLRTAVGASSQVLTRCLRELERDGLVARQVFAEVPVRVEYSLTELGQTICDPVHAIRDWAEKHAGELRAARQRYDRPEAPRGGSSPD